MLRFVRGVVAFASVLVVLVGVGIASFAVLAGISSLMHMARFGITYSRNL
jgi:hypothetical protein